MGTSPNRHCRLCKGDRDGSLAEHILRAHPGVSLDMESDPITGATVVTGVLYSAGISPEA